MEVVGVEWELPPFYLPNNEVDTEDIVAGRPGGSSG